VYNIIRFYRKAGSWNFSDGDETKAAAGALIGYDERYRKCHATRISILLTAICMNSDWQQPLAECDRV
ncbi:hypothetical protein, partial [Rhizobium tropici]|uniref:hypothetical protein n=1 Tax=Rhizobium tropici TaxID=398 RepID=UPI001A913EA7